VIFCNSGFEAVEAALKTAMLATGRPGVIAFEGAYHGVGYGALNTTHREHFRGPFRSQLAEFGHFVPFPANACRRSPSLKVIESSIRQLFRRKRIGAILVEPIQVRGGINIPPAEFLPMLRNLCDEHEALLILDEIYTGFGRTGKWFACEHNGVVPDLICLGKALTGGFPLSACVGHADLMDAAWPKSTGEAIHTSTFLGHPVGCAMALENILQIQRQNLIERSHELGALLLESLESIKSRLGAQQVRTGRFSFHPRGLGLLAGVQFSSKSGKAATAIALEVNKRMLHRGFIILPEGKESEVLSLTPPLTIKKSQLKSAVAALEATLVSLGKPK
jgi:4-aminobutyrate aminotransferase-like enzyme